MGAMKKSLLLVLVFVGCALAADTVSACTAECVNVGPGFCMRCQDVGRWTNMGCQDVGACGCYETQEICFNSALLAAPTDAAAPLADLDQAVERSVLGASSAELPRR